MTWEWRVFFPLESDGSLDVWSLLRAQDRCRSSSPERRTDVYLRCAHGAGLKIRGRRLIEVKLRTSRDSDVGAELWRKVVKCHINWDGSDLAVLCDQFKRELEKEKSRRDTARSLEEALTCLSTPHQQKLVELHKERRTKYLNRVHVEQTDITVSGTPGDQQKSAGKWRSIAVEGGELEDIVEFLSVKVRPSSCQDRETSLGEYVRAVGGEPRGYAQFVMELPPAYNLGLPITMDTAATMCHFN